MISFYKLFVLDQPYRTFDLKARCSACRKLFLAGRIVKILTAVSRPFDLKTIRSIKYFKQLRRPSGMERLSLEL